jgi:DNA-binding IclR family transcriptional regulator
MERATSLEKALEVCEALSVSGRGLTVSELSRALALPPPTVHRLLKVLKRRGYVRQDEETTRYSLTLKMLDLSFRLMGRSELRLHAYPVIREHVLRTAERAFFAVPAAGEVTYVWRVGPDEVGTYTAYGREMPGHCAIFFEQADRGPGLRRLSCVRLGQAREVSDPSEVIVRLGAPRLAPQGQRMLCTCAPVCDYTGREVARLGLFAHAMEERGFVDATPRAAWDLARQVSQRLGYLPNGEAMTA